MESLYLPSTPNIFGLKLHLMLQIFFTISALLVLTFLLWYLIVKYRGRKKLYKQLQHIQSQASHLGKQILVEKIKTSQDKSMLLFFVEYLERFSDNLPYHSVEQLLSQHGFDPDEVDLMSKILYQGGQMDEKIREKIVSKV